MGLFASVQGAFKIFREEQHAICFLLGNDILCFRKIIAIVSHLNIGCSIEHSYKFARRSRMRLVDNYHRNLAHHLVIVNPRVE